MDTPAFSSRSHEPWDRPSRRKSKLDLVTSTRPGFLILLALAHEPLSTAEISTQIIGDTMGRYVKHASLYDEMKRLEQAALIDRRGTGRPRAWQLTNEGRRLLKLELAALKRVSEVAQSRGLW